MYDNPDKLGNDRKVIRGKTHLTNGVVAVNTDHKTGTQCREYHVNPDLALLNHFRSTCVPKMRNKCDEMKSNLVRDTALTQHRDEIVQRIRDSADRFQKWSISYRNKT